MFHPPGATHRLHSPDSSVFDLRKDADAVIREAEEAAGRGSEAVQARSLPPFDERGFPIRDPGRVFTRTGVCGIVEKIRGRESAARIRLCPGRLIIGGSKRVP
jgi:hypothetical protein